MISEVFSTAATLIKTQGWCTGVEQDESRRWCLMGAVGGARLQLMSRPEKQRFINRKGYAHYDQAVRTPFAALLHDDEELRRAVCILSAAYRSMVGLTYPGDDRPRIDYRDFRAIEKAASDMMGWNDEMTGPTLVIDLLYRAGMLAYEIEAEERERSRRGYSDDMRWQAQRIRHLEWMVERQREMAHAELRALTAVPPLIITGDDGWPSDADLKAFFTKELAAVNS